MPVKMEICPLAKQSEQFRCAVIDFLAKLSRNEACGQLAFSLMRLCWAKQTRETRGRENSFNEFPDVVIFPWDIHHTQKKGSKFKGLPPCTKVTFLVETAEDRAAVGHPKG